MDNTGLGPVPPVLGRTVAGMAEFRRSERVDPTVVLTPKGEPPPVAQTGWDGDAPPLPKGAGTHGEVSQERGLAVMFGIPPIIDFLVEGIMGFRPHLVAELEEGAHIQWCIGGYKANFAGALEGVSPPGR